MLQLRSIVNVADNTGAKKVGVFKVLGGTRKRYAQIGDLVVVSVKEAEPRKAVKKKEVLQEKYDVLKCNTQLTDKLHLQHSQKDMYLLIFLEKFLYLLNLLLNHHLRLREPMETCLQETTSMNF